jgi:hypothetical protein
MGFLFAIPSFIIHFLANLLSWFFSLIGGILGIVIWPFKLVWGLFMGVGKLLISVLVAPFLLFSHPAEISAAQPVVGTVPPIPNNRIEQIFNDIKSLELAGRQMEPLRNNENLGQCGILMRDYQIEADNLVEITNDLPRQYKATLGAAAISLNECVSCKTTAQNSCERVRDNLNDYQSMISEE